MNGIHFLDSFLMLAGEKPVEVSASHSTLATPENEVEDTLAMWIRFANGALATVQVSSCSMGMTQNGPQMRLYGQDGSLSLGRPDQVFTERAGLGYDPGRWQTFDPLPAMKPMGVEMVERFASGVRSGEMEISGREGLKVQAVIEAAYRSMRESRPIRLSEFEEGAS
jgi:predicted dehydrogenase